jgi:TetR/AcrR family transcriptional regulator, transcriptional repressor for nem operon
MSSDPASPGTRVQLMDLAQSMIQQRGFNAFSFRDLAAAAGIKSASVHHHFSTKQALGLDLVRRYTADLVSELDRITSSPGATARARLRAFMALFEDTAAAGDRLCLAGMLASDVETLGEPLQEEVRAFFRTAERWLAEQIGAAGPRRSPKQRAALAGIVLSTLQGALLSARLLGEPARVKQATEQLMLLIQRDAS